MPVLFKKLVFLFKNKCCVFKNPFFQGGWGGLGVGVAFWPPTLPPEIPFPALTMAQQQSAVKTHRPPF